MIEDLAYVLIYVILINGGLLPHTSWCAYGTGYAAGRGLTTKINRHTAPRKARYLWRI